MSPIKSVPSMGCRVCLKGNSNETLFPITTIWTPSNEQETIKDKLLFCVPSLNIADDSKICGICLNQLKATTRFIAKCLKAEIVFSDLTLVDTNSSKNNDCVLGENIGNVHGATTEVNDYNNDVDVSQDCDTTQQDPLEVTQNINDLIVSCFDKNKSKVLFKVKQTNDVPPELNKELDFAPYKLNFVSASMPISSQQRKDMLKVGINTIDMSSNLNGKKRVIFVARNYYPTNVNCHLCSEELTSTCDISDHTFLHQQHRIVTSEGPSFPCDFCFQKFSDEEALSIHCVISHKVTHKMNCNKCTKSFRSLTNLLKHESEFKDSDKCAYKCTKCSKQFATKTTLEAHMKDVTDAPCCDYVLCKVCSVKFSKKDFKEHSKIHPSYLCSDCGKSFTSYASLHSHTSNVHRNLSIMCDKCGKILKSADALRNHLQHQHETIKPSFACDKCPKMFKFNHRLRRHILMRHSEQPPKVTCAICTKSCGSKDELRAHIKLIHEEPKGYECSLCGSKFSRKDYLKRHLNRHEVYSRFTCAICKISFASEWRLKAHEDLGHDENGKARNYGRGSRGGRANRPTRSYQLSIKKANKPCICKICHKVLVSRQYLQMHYKIHLRIREKKCEKCGLVMANAGSYGRHMKLHEDPDFDMRCRVCYVTKSSKLELQEHIETVHKHLKYECRYCGKRFGRKHLLYSHENLEHKETTEKRKEALKIINRETVFVPDDVVVVPKPRKGTKLDDYHNTDVDDLIKKISHGETVAPAPSCSDVKFCYFDELDAVSYLEY